MREITRVRRDEYMRIHRNCQFDQMIVRLFRQIGAPFEMRDTPSAPRNNHLKKILAHYRGKSGVTEGGL